MRMDATWTDRFAGIDRLYGVGALAHFARCHVVVVGLGGVGSWVVEALARSGIGRMTLIDADDLCVSNTNRQLPALEGAYGRNKAEAMAERCRAINPAIQVEAVQAFPTGPNPAQTIDPGPDPRPGRRVACGPFRAGSAFRGAGGRPVGASGCR